MSPESKHEINLVPGQIADLTEFKSGLHFCVAPGEFEVGEPVTERRVLPSAERALFADDESIDPSKRPYAEDKTVIVTGLDGGNIWVSDAFHDGDELTSSGSSKECTLTEEGWIVPKGLSAEVMGNITAEDIIKGYFLPFDGQSNGELRETEDEMALVLAKPLTIAKMKQLNIEAPRQY